jgi:predicted nucleic acid-binding protein
VIQAVFLDSSLLGLLANPRPSPERVASTTWLRLIAVAGVRVLVPEICDYEVRRELIRANRLRGLAQLEALISLSEYVPLTTAAMRQAAQSWAQARQQGQPTAGDRMIDCDMILVGQMLTFGLPTSEIVVATTNLRHLARFVPAAHWLAIRP